MNSESRNHYVYMHRRPDSGEPFYVGLGSSPNYARAKATASRNPHWKAIYKKCGRTIEILSDGLTADEAAAIENLAIIRMKKKGVPLVNMAHGGAKGRLGAKWGEEERISRLETPRQPWSEDWKAKRREEMRGKYSDGKHPGIGLRRTQEQCAKFSAAKMGDKNPMWRRQFSEEHREKLGAARRKQVGTPRPALRRPMDMKQHIFCHQIFGEWRGLQYDFAEASGLPRQKVNALIKGRRLSCRQWTYQGTEK